MKTIVFDDALQKKIWDAIQEKGILEKTGITEPISLLPYFQIEEFYDTVEKHKNWKRYFIPFTDVLFACLIGTESGRLYKIYMEKIIPWFKDKHLGGAAEEVNPQKSVWFRDSLKKYFTPH